GKMVLGLFTRPKIKPLPSPVSPALTPIDKTPIPLEEERIVPPAEPVKTPEPTLALSGIFFQQDKGYALINNQILKVGDTIQGAKVEEINLDKVILEFEGRKITLINSSR
ncbi:MAG: general secretion pathway protein GspB, partial [Candidatus Omnitrophota bacterium]